ncbi:MAG: TldD/PmbA family protein, partial [Clostridia bacterium]|nr:TldD/PmbA family protein [Clostridia bacterium]
FGAVFTDQKTPLIELAGGRQIIEDSLKQITPVPLKGKFVGDVIFTPSCFCDILASVAGNFLSDGALIDGTSLWKDKVGTLVASPLLNWSCRPQSDELADGAFVSEGYVTRNADVIKDGVLQSYLLGRYGAKKTGLGRFPAVDGYYFVDGGNESLDDMIASVEHGLLVGRFSGGDPTSDGTMSGVAKNSFEIRDGKICDAVSEVMISGNLAKMMADITALSKERINDGVRCLPWVKISGITVSGQ